MATVQYTVLYRYIHPVSNRPISNKSTGYKCFVDDKATSTGGVAYSLSVTPAVTFKNSDLPLGVKLEDYQIQRNYPTGKEFDMLYFYKGTATINSYNAYNIAHEIIADVFDQVKGDPWMVASVSGSLEAAMATATRLVKKIGINNVKLVKNVPIEIQIGIE